MGKKFSCLFASFLLMILLVGCTGFMDKDMPSYAGVGAASFGMSAKEAFAALKTNPEDWEESKPMSDEAAVNTTYVNHTVKIYGVKAKVSLTFCNLLDLGLVAGSIGYSDDKAGEKAAEQIRKELTSLYGDPVKSGVTLDNVVQYGWDSTLTVGEALTAEQWNDGKPVDLYIDEVWRVKKEAGTNAGEKLKGKYDKDRLCFSIVDMKSVNGFSFDGFYQAIVNAVINGDLG